MQAQEGSHCLDKPFKACPEPDLGHLRVQEKTSVTWAVIAVLLQSYLLYRDLVKVLKVFNIIFNDKIRTMTLQSLYLTAKVPNKKKKRKNKIVTPPQTNCEPKRHKGAKSCCYMIDKQNQSLQKSRC